MKHVNYLKSTVFITLIFTVAVFSPCRAQSASEITQKSQNALQQLCSVNKAARHLRSSAKAILVFPEIYKAGFIFGVQHGEGALLSHGNPIRYYRTSAASYGMQAGVQRFGYAMFFMNNEDLTYIRETHGWEFGTGPSIVIVDEGIARTISTTTLQKGVYVFTFDQQGLMAGLGLQGSKITPFTPQ